MSRRNRCLAVGMIYLFLSGSMAAPQQTGQQPVRRGSSADPTKDTAKIEQPPPKLTDRSQGTCVETSPDPGSKRDFDKWILPTASLAVALLAVLALFGLLFFGSNGAHVKSQGGGLGGGEWKYELSPCAAMLVIVLACILALVGLGYESVAGQAGSSASPLPNRQAEGRHR